MKKAKSPYPPRRRWVTALVIILGLLVGVLTSAWVYVYGLLGQINYEKTPDTISIGATFKPLVDDRLSDADEQLKELRSGDVMEDSAVTNILLIGTDTREPGRMANSDTMILFSYNRDTQKIMLTSFMRDMYVTIPEVGNYKMNHATMVGGPDLLLRTLEQNFKVKVDHYVLVDFYSFAKIVDVLGGVELEVTENERFYLNYSVQRMNEKEGRPADSNLLDQAGLVNLTGAQAVGYSRIRAVGNADYQRTSRQRIVMTKIIEKLKGASAGELLEVMEEVLPYVTTNMDKGQLFSYVTEAPTMLKSPLEQLRLPDDGLYSSVTIDGMDVLLPDYAANIIQLQETIYNRNNIQQAENIK
ncbi:MAG: LCP family protein [Fastidiosipilaceae bacterium]|jgi:LCP family protein required for cell wall assembly